MSDITRILSEIQSVDPSAADQLLPLVYHELRKLAAAKLANEKPLRLVGGETSRSYRDRSHFFGAAATAMRHILVDNARAKLADKRGGNHERKPLEDLAAQQPGEELLALHEALDELAAEDPVKAKLVELRYFAGLTGDQAAEVLGISATTADRHWVYARAWLQAKVRG